MTNLVNELNITLTESVICLPLFLIVCLLFVILYLKCGLSSLGISYKQDCCIVRLLYLSFTLMVVYKPLPEFI